MSYDDVYGYDQLKICV